MLDSKWDTGLYPGHFTGLYPGQPGRRRPSLACLVWATWQPHCEGRRGAGSTFSSLTILLESCMIMGTIWHINRKHGIFPLPFHPGDSRAITDMLQVYHNELSMTRGFCFLSRSCESRSAKIPSQKIPWGLRGWLYKQCPSHKWRQKRDLTFRSTIEQLSK